MPYELWDMDSGNIVGAYQTEAEALDVVRQEIAANGRDSIEEWVLGQILPGPDGDPVVQLFDSDYLHALLATRI